MSSITNIIGTKYQSLFDPKILKNFRVDGILYKSIYHYVYSNIVYFDLDNKSLNNANTKDVYTEYLEIETNSRNQIIHDSCERAIESRFAFGQPADLLIGTGDSILLYTSDNRELGTGSDMLGKNLYGKMLMNFRQKLRLKRETEMKEKSIENIESVLYKNYSVYLGLRQRMTRDLDDLSDFIGLSLDAIINKLGKQKLFDITPSPDVIFSLYNREEIQDKDIIDNPAYIVKLIRRKYIQQINSDIKILREKAIIESFVDWLIEYKSVEYSLELDRTEIKYEQLNNITSKQKDRILRLYESGKLNDIVKQQVDERMSVVRAEISQEDIDTAKSFELPAVDVNQVDEEKIDDASSKVKQPRTAVRLQESNDYNDYFSNLFVKFFRQKTKREKQTEEEDIKEKLRLEEQKQIEEEIEKEMNFQELLERVDDKKSKAPIRKKRQGAPVRGVEQDISVRNYNFNPQGPRPPLSTIPLPSPFNDPRRPPSTIPLPSPVNNPRRPPSTIRFVENPIVGYFGTLSPLAVDLNVFYVDSYAYPSIYHYIMTRLIEMLPTVKTLSKAHGYIMSKTDSTNVNTYKSFEVLDKEYDELYNIERVVKITELLEKCLPIVLPPIERIKEMYQNDLDHNYIYNISDDTLLGTIGKNNGYNIYGIELTKFIKSTLNQPEKVILKQEYKDLFIKKRIEDICNTLKTVINTSKTGNTLGLKDTFNIIHVLYDPCFEILTRDSSEATPYIYEQFIRTLLTKEQLHDDGIDYIYSLVSRVYDILEENIEPNIDANKYISSMRAGALNSRSFSCVGPYKTKSENCLFAGVVGVIEKFRNIHGDYISSDKLDYVFMLLINNSERIDYVDLEDDDIPKIKSLLSQFGDNIVNNSSSINGFIKTVSKNIPNDILMRVLFFGQSVYKPVKEKIEIKLSRVDTIGDGSCFFHALLTTFPKYREMSDSGKRDYAYRFRKDIATGLSLEYFISSPIFEALIMEGEDDVTKVYKRFIKNLTSPSYWTDHYMISYTAMVLGLNVITLDKKRKIILLDEEKPGNLPKIYITSINNKHFEILMDKARDQYVF